MRPKQHLKPNCAQAQAGQSKSPVRQIYEDRAKCWTLYVTFKHPSKKRGRTKSEKNRAAKKHRQKRGHGVSQETRHDVPRKRKAETHLGNEEVPRARHLPQLPLHLLSRCRLLLIITGETKHRAAKNQKRWRLAKNNTKKVTSRVTKAEQKKAKRAR